MSDTEPVFLRVARSVMVSSVAAGAVAGIAGMFGAGQRSKKSSPEARLKAARSRVLDAVPEDAIAQLQETAHRVADRSSSPRKRQKMKKSTGKKAREAVERMQDTTAQGTHRIGEAASGAAADTIDRLNNASIDGHDVRQRAQHAFDQQRATLEARRRHMQEDSAKRISGLRSDLASTVEGRVKPTLAWAGENAEHLAGDLRSRLNGELSHLAEIAEQRRPQLASAAEQASARISQVLKEADASSDEWRETAEHALRDAEMLIQENASVARKRAGEVGETAKQESQNLVSLLFWLTVAGGLVYTVLLNEEQKRKAKDIASSVWHEGREMYLDIQGRDAEFE